MPTFRVVIVLGNDAMKTPENVANALREIAEAVAKTGVREGNVVDGNGNVVGTFKYAKR